MDTKCPADTHRKKTQERSRAPGNVPAFFSAAKVRAICLTLRTYLNKSLEIYPDTQCVDTIEDTRLAIGIIQAQS